MRKSVRQRKSSISKAGSYSEIGKFWDEHDLAELWHKTRKLRGSTERPFGESPEASNEPSRQCHCTDV